MKITADRSVCVGAGNCAFTAPELFDQDESDGVVIVIKDLPDPGDEEESAREAAAFCPSGAITVAD
ncbi:MAG TPA: ferredoxin [Microlunatus sp.]|nr:ferredoxin [Microlunatus sp.]